MRALKKQNKQTNKQKSKKKPSLFKMSLEIVTINDNFDFDSSEFHFYGEFSHDPKVPVPKRVFFACTRPRYGKEHGYFLPYSTQDKLGPLLILPVEIVCRTNKSRYFVQINTESGTARLVCVIDTKTYDKEYQIKVFEEIKNKTRDSINAVVNRTRTLKTGSVVVEKFHISVGVFNRNKHLWEGTRDFEGIYHFLE